MNIKDIIKNWKRVLQIARKPTKEEFTITSKVCGLGLIIIGFVGFVIFIISLISCSFGGICL
ncbi:MAG: protein translocase SEC61 complex subunit gamma [Candidatus Aenigmarchaeota archaeon]|nr:protein translocase SEC61 complex subunit gamma [Candidatus Aenigmarchaeota archaeon]